MEKNWLPKSFQNLNIEKLKSIYNDLITKSKYKKIMKKKIILLCSLYSC